MRLCSLYDKPFSSVCIWKHVFIWRLYECADMYIEAHWYTKSTARRVCHVSTQQKCSIPLPTLFSSTLAINRYVYVRYIYIYISECSLLPFWCTTAYWKCLYNCEINENPYCRCCNTFHVSSTYIQKGWSLDTPGMNMWELKTLCWKRATFVSPWTPKRTPIQARNPAKMKHDEEYNKKDAQEISRRERFTYSSKLQSFRCFLNTS